MLSLYLFYVILAAILDIIANLLLHKSNGFKNLKYGISSLLLVFLAFYLLTLSLAGIKLTIAYTLWGVIGILGTTLGGWYFFQQKLKPIGYVGIFLMLLAVILLQSA